ncbi:MAG: hypothetical protein INR69_09135 [Mucilaginibacter polytrichastri]|nr:hypothetical protein [Mucilaginibacter polytrichastri]
MRKLYLYVPIILMVAACRQSREASNRYETITEISQRHFITKTLRNARLLDKMKGQSAQRYSKVQDSLITAFDHYIADSVKTFKDWKFVLNSVSAYDLITVELEIPVFRTAVAQKDTSKNILFRSAVINNSDDLLESSLKDKLTGMRLGDTVLVSGAISMHAGSKMSVRHFYEPGILLGNRQPTFDILMTDVRTAKSTL